MHKKYQDIGRDSSQQPDEPERIRVRAEETPDGAAIEIGGSWDEGRPAGIELTREKSAKVLSALKSAIRAVREETSMERVTVEHDDPEMRAAAIVRVARGRVYLTVRSLTRRKQVWLEPDVAESFAEALEETISDVE